jgi:SOS-response transcriptional repressor LexA
MSFTEQTRLAVKRKAAFRCCRCHEIGIDIHHIIPQHEGGPDDIENAAPLCQNCHSLLGDNPRKRSEIRQMRDWWYSIVAERYGSPVLQRVRNFDVSDYYKKSDLLSRRLAKSLPISKAFKEFSKILKDSLSISLDKVQLKFKESRPGDLFIVEFVGNSMFPRIHDGDLLLVDPAQRVRSGDICLVRALGQDTITVVELDDEVMNLIPANGKYEPWTVNRSDVEFAWKVVNVFSDL